MCSVFSFIPEKSIPKVRKWIDTLNVRVIISNPRSTKLGDFRVKNNFLLVSVNNNLNPFSFLITLTHELAHAFVYKTYGNSVSPHGKEWKEMFRSMLLAFMSTDYFPEDILKVLSIYIKNPKASTLTDFKLANTLRLYNKNKSITLLDIEEGSTFQSRGRLFVKGKKRRTRFKCIEKKTNREYLFHPLAEVIFVQ